MTNSTGTQQKRNIKWATARKEVASKSAVGQRVQAREVGVSGGREATALASWIQGERENVKQARMFF